MSNFTYDPRSRRYREVSSGRYITAREVRAAVDAVIESYQSEVLALAARLQQGGLTLSEWQVQTAQSIKALHVATAAAANGGFNNMAPADWGYVGSLVKRQYQYLRGFAADIASGKQLVQSGGFTSRVKLYAQAARSSFEAVQRRAAKFGGALEERREIGAADHCGPCVELAGRGWVEIGTLPMIGEATPCLVNCHCSFEYRVAPTQQTIE
jgi:hypothetical protein